MCCVIAIVQWCTAATFYTKRYNNLHNPESTEFTKAQHNSVHKVREQIIVEQLVSGST